MSYFNEHALEMAIMELFEQQGYSYVNGETIHKEQTEVLLRDDLRMYLMDRYAQEGITLLEVERVIAKLTADNGAPFYEQNAQTYRLMTEGFAIKREDASLLDLFVEVIDFDDTERNIFKAPEQAPEQVNDLLHTSNTYIIRLIKEKNSLCHTSTNMPWKWASWSCLSSKDIAIRVVRQFTRNCRKSF